MTIRIHNTILYNQLNSKLDLPYSNIIYITVMVIFLYTNEIAFEIHFEQLLYRDTYKRYLLIFYHILL